MPVTKCVFREPDGQVAAPAKPGLVLYSNSERDTVSSCISAGYDVGISAASRFSTAGSDAAS